MKLLVVGSRSIKAFDLSPYISADVDTVISGGADGIDALAEQYADRHRLSKYIVRPCYEMYGRAAPLKRNAQMVDMADAVLIIWDGRSKGTQYTLNYARKTNKPIQLVQIKKRTGKIPVLCHFHANRSPSEGRLRQMEAHT